MYNSKNEPVKKGVLFKLNFADRAFLYCEKLNYCVNIFPMVVIELTDLFFNIKTVAPVIRMGCKVAFFCFVTFACCIFLRLL